MAGDIHERVATIILGGFDHFDARFRDVTGRAAARFAVRDWRGLRADSEERLELYAECVAGVVEKVRGVLGDRVEDRTIWAGANGVFTAAVHDRPNREIACTFFNSITRRIFHTVGVDPDIEFIGPAIGTAAAALPPRRTYRGPGSIEELLDQILDDTELGGGWQNRRRDVLLAAGEIRAHLELIGAGSVVNSAEALIPVFYRSQGAYIVGMFRAGEHTVPMALAVHNTSRGLMIGAVLLEVDDISILFSYTRSSFHVAADRPCDLVAYLQGLMPHKRRAELYTLLGFHKHGKTELFRDFLQHVASTDDRFEHARGIRGMVMIVFTMPGYDVVFKVIRDRFPFPKQTTRRRIMDKYRLVFRHDRAGRLIEAQEFEHLRFDRSRFTEELLDELRAEASRSVTIAEDSVTLHHVYVERRVAPLDLYVREANPVKANAAIIDYGWAIKNLAAMNIFPGDMLLKNFGVTRSGRVVFYDYDELTLLTECNFREIPDSSDPTDEMSADPWFGVGDQDVFPEEFRRFMGIRDELRREFEYHHGDLFGVRFWQRVQDRVESGEIIEIFPYKRERRLGANIMNGARARASVAAGTGRPTVGAAP